MALGAHVVGDHARALLQRQALAQLVLAADAQSYAEQEYRMLDMETVFSEQGPSAVVQPPHSPGTWDQFVRKWRLLPGEAYRWWKFSITPVARLADVLAQMGGANLQLQVRPRRQGRPRRTAAARGGAAETAGQQAPAAAAAWCGDDDRDSDEGREVGSVVVSASSLS